MILYEERVLSICQSTNRAINPIMPEPDVLTRKVTSVSYIKYHNIFSLQVILIVYKIQAISK